ncbi:hypothetical protein [Telluribacter humicola]|uniref:hypothetical protein n=1 Tax=Telluribacter humicola TaxID=1720261 RepID=UPI001A958810|nr:hypothetical protein [Telluribacter humicola]
MSNKKGLPFPLIIIVIILGGAIFKQFDSENLKLKEPALAVVYILTFLVSVYWLVKHYKAK